MASMLATPFAASVSGRVQLARPSRSAPRRSLVVRAGDDKNIIEKAVDAVKGETADATNRNRAGAANVSFKTNAGPQGDAAYGSDAGKTKRKDDKVKYDAKQKDGDVSSPHP